MDESDELPANVRRAIILDEMSGVGQMIYRLTVRAKVRRAIGDTKTAETVARELETLERVLDEYRKELAKIEEAKS